MPHAPRTPGTPGTPGRRLRLSPIRPKGSVELDGYTMPVRKGEPPGDPIGTLAPFRPWSEFYDEFARAFDQGHHVTLVGRNGSGKTVLSQRVIDLRTYVAVAATKKRDPSLYAPLEKIGFEIVPYFYSEPLEHPRLIVRPEIPTIKELRPKQQRVFGEMLDEVYQLGDWCVYADEVRYLTDTLRLAEQFEVLWLQGRSLGVSVVAGTQRPVSIPREAFSQARHFFFFAEYEKDNVDRMGEFAGRDSDLVRKIVMRLPEFEFLYVNTVTGDLVRSKVELNPKDRPDAD